MTHFLFVLLIAFFVGCAIVLLDYAARILNFFAGRRRIETICWRTERREVAIIWFWLSIISAFSVYAAGATLSLFIHAISGV